MKILDDLQLRLNKIATAVGFAATVLSEMRRRTNPLDDADREQMGRAQKLLEEAEAVFFGKE